MYLIYNLVTYILSWKDRVYFVRWKWNGESVDSVENAERSAEGYGKRQNDGTKT
jgi:hypothetical protein